MTNDDDLRTDIINAINAAHWEVFEASDGNRSIRPKQPDSGDLADAVLAVLPAPAVVDEAEVRERIAQDIEADRTPAPWSEGRREESVGHWLDSRDATKAARIARGVTR